jgi:hypothetical protein
MVPLHFTAAFYYLLGSGTHKELSFPVKIDLPGRKT